MGDDFKLHQKLFLRPTNQLNSTTTARELCYWENLRIFSHIIVILIFWALIVAVKYGSEILAKIFYHPFYLKMYILRVFLSLKIYFWWKYVNFDHIKKWPVLPNAG